MTWQAFFRQGVNAFRMSDYEEALLFFDEAISKGGERYTVYDSRAAVYERLGNYKQVLRDSRKVIELAPEKRHGYVRSARIFLQQEKYKVAIDMVRLALDRIKPHDAAHRLELEELQRTISEAMDLRAAAEARSKPHFRKLPVELISEVFLFATEMDIAFPTSACLVCPNWRTIALSIPSLWQCVSLSHLHPVKKLSLWTERSKNRITALRIRANISRLQLRDAIESCGPGLHKTLRSVYSEMDPHLFFSCFIGIPDIQHLDLNDIQLCVQSRKQIDRAAISLFPLVPLVRMSSARSLIVEYVTVDWPIVAPQLSNLRTLIIRTTFEVPTTTFMCMLLGVNPHLEKVIVETGSPMDLDEVREEARVDLPRLTHLEFMGPMDVRGLISRFTLPCLERLSISQCLSAVDQALLVLEPSFPALVELCIHRCSFSEERLASILQRISTLTKLEITHTGCSMDRVVDALAGSTQVDGETRLLYPQLRHVDFSHCPNLNGGAIVRLVKPRLIDIESDLTQNSLPKQIPARIEAVHINGCPKIDPSVPEWLRSRVDKVSCIYMTKKEMRKTRR